MKHAVKTIPIWRLLMDPSCDQKIAEIRYSVAARRSENRDFNGIEWWFSMGFYGGLIGSNKNNHLVMTFTAVCPGKIHHAFLRTVCTIYFDKWAMVIFHG